MEQINKNDNKYLEAKKRVQRMKGFYIHALVYFLVNLFLLYNIVKSNGDLSNFNNYWTAIFWGVGLAAHGLSVFLPNMILGRDWEEKKIRELMNRNK
jgi:hypothetical protein